MNAKFETCPCPDGTFTVLSLTHGRDHVAVIVGGVQVIGRLPDVLPRASRYSRGDAERIARVLNVARR